MSTEKQDEYLRKDAKHAEGSFPFKLRGNIAQFKNKIILMFLCNLGP